MARTKENALAIINKRKQATSVSAQETKNVSTSPDSEKTKENALATIQKLRGNTSVRDAGTVADHGNARKTAFGQEALVNPKEKWVASHVDWDAIKIAEEGSAKTKSETNRREELMEKMKKNDPYGIYEKRESDYINPSVKASIENARSRARENLDSRRPKPVHEVSPVFAERPVDEKVNDIRWDKSINDWISLQKETARIAAENRGYAYTDVWEIRPGAPYSNNVAEAAKKYVSAGEDSTEKKTAFEKVLAVNVALENVELDLMYAKITGDTDREEDLKGQRDAYSNLKTVYEVFAEVSESVPDYKKYVELGRKQIKKSDGFSFVGWLGMNEKELDAMSYLAGKYGDQKAGEFLFALENAFLAERRGKAEADRLANINIPVVEQLAYGLKSIERGVNYSVEGIAKNFGHPGWMGKSDEYAGYYIDRELAKHGPKIGDKSLAQYAYGAGEVVGGMLPSVLLAKGFSKAGASSKAAGLAGMTFQGLSASGHAYVEAKERGHSELESRAYSLAVGASEVATQKLLSGVGGMTGNIPAKYAAKIAASDRALLRVLGTGALNISSEILEETLQLYLEPLYAEIFLGEEYTAPEVEDIVYTAIVTAFSTGTLNTGEVIDAGKSRVPIGKGIITEGTEAITNTIESGLDAPEGSSAHILALELRKALDKGESLSPHKVGLLAEEIVREAVANPRKSATEVIDAEEDFPSTLEETAEMLVSDNDVKLNEADTVDNVVEEVSYEDMTDEELQRQYFREQVDALGEGKGMPSFDTWMAEKIALRDAEVNESVATKADLEYNRDSNEGRSVVSGREGAETGVDGRGIEDRTGYRGTGSGVLSEFKKPETELGGSTEVRTDIYEPGLVRTRGLNANNPTDARWDENDYVSVDADSVTGKVQREGLDEYGIDTYVVKDKAWAKIEKKAPAYSRNGQIYLRENLSQTEKAGLIPHEASHVMKQKNYTPYVEFVSKLPEKVNMSSEHTQRIFAQVAEHRKLSGIDLSSKQEADFWDEFNAMVYGSVQIAKDQEIDYEWVLGEVFHDLDGYLAEMDSVHEAFKKQNVAARQDRKGEVESGEEIHIRESGERIDSQNSGGEVRILEETPGRDKRRRRSGGPADSGAASLTLGEKVSVASLGIGKGTREASIRLVKGGDTAATHAARKIAKERGLRLVLFAGENMTFRGKDGKTTRARAYISGDRVFVRADHPEFTAEQLMRHEAGHDMIAKGEIDLDAVRKRIGKENAEKAVNLYTLAYEGSGLSAEEIFEEIVCDSLGDMNIFSDTFAESEASKHLGETRGAVLEMKRDVMHERAPPIGAKMSRESEYKKINKQAWRQIQRERMNKYGNKFDAMPRVDIFNAHDMLFVVENFDETSFGVLDAVDPAKNEAKTELVREVMENGNIEYAEEYRRRAENLRSWKRRNARNHMFAENSGTRREDVGVYAHNGRTAGGKYSVGKSGENSKGKFSLESETISKLKREKTPPVADGKLSRETSLERNKFLQRMFSGEIKIDSEYFADTQELAMIRVAVKSGNGRLGKTKRFGSVFAYHNYYLFKFNEDYSITIENVFDPESDNSIIEMYEKEFGSGSRKNGKITIIDPWSQLVRSRQRGGVSDNVGGLQQTTSSGNSDVVDGRQPEDVVRNGRGRNLYSNFRKSDGNSESKSSLESDVIRRLKQEKRELEKKVSYLRGEFKRTPDGKIDSVSVKRATRELISRYSSSMSPDEISGEVEALFDYMSIDGVKESFDVDEMWDRAQGIARKIAETAIAREDSLYREYADLRKYAREAGFSLSESDRSDISDFNQFRKKNFGKMKIVNGKTNVDSIYREMAELWPAFFNEEEVSHPANQLVHISEVLDDIYNIEEKNPYSSHMESAIDTIANDIISRYTEMPNAKKTFADRAADAVYLEKVRGDARVKKALERISKYQKESETRVSKIRERYREKTKEGQKKQRERELRGKIMRATHRMDMTLRRPSDKKRIPQELQVPVANLLKAINLEGMYTYDENGKRVRATDGTPTQRTLAFRELRDIYKKISGKEDMIVVSSELLEGGASAGGEILEQVVQLQDIPLHSMNEEQLGTVWKAIRIIESSVRTANKMFSDKHFKTISDAAETIKNSARGKDTRIDIAGVSKVQNLVALDSLTPEAYFHRLGSGGDAIFRMLRDAQDKHTLIIDEIREFASGLVDGVKIHKLETTTHKVVLGGEEVTLSTAQLMELYALSKREQAEKHILEGGIRPERIPGVARVIRNTPIKHISPKEIGNAFENLTDEEKKMSEKLSDFASKNLGTKMNDACLKVFGYEKFGERHYWPIRTDPTAHKSDAKEVTKATPSISNYGMAKATTPGANTPLLIGSIFDTFSSHSAQAATYAAYLEVMEDFRRIFNFSFKDADGEETGNIKGILNRVFGSGGTRYWENLMEDISVGIKGEDSGLFDGILRQTKAASVSMNIRVMAQQPTAILRAGELVDYHYIVGGMAHSKRGWNRAKKYAPIAKWKSYGFFDANTGPKIKSLIYDQSGKLEKLREIGMAGAGMMDSFGWGTIWSACELELEAKIKRGKGSFIPKTERFEGYNALRYGDDVERYEYLKKKKPLRVTKISGTEIVHKGNVSSYIGEDGKLDYSRLRKDAIRWATEHNVLGTVEHPILVKNKDTGMGISIDKTSITSGFAKGNTISQVKILPHLHELLRNAVDVDVRYGEDSRDATDRTLVATHTFIAAIGEGDKTIPVKLTVKERTSGDSLYSNLVLEHIDKINEEAITSTGKLRNISRSLGADYTDLTSSEISITELFSKVKDEKTRKYIPPQFFGKPASENNRKEKALEILIQPGTEEFYNAVAERFTEIIDHTQVVDGVLQRSQIMRSSNALTKMATSYMSEPTKVVNMFSNAVYDTTHAKTRAERKAAGKRLVRTSFSLLVSFAVNAALGQALVDALRDDDKEKEYWEKWMDAFTENFTDSLNPLTYFPYIKDAYSIYEGYSVGRMDLGGIENLIESTRNVIKAFSGESKYTVEGTINNACAVIGSLFGLGTANVKRDVRAAAMLFATGTDNYVMEYRMEKGLLELTYEKNGNVFYDILFKAYSNDRKAFEIIYNDMVEGGFDGEKIKKALEKRMKKAQGVEEVTDLDERFLSPKQTKEYNSGMSEVRKSPIWKKATEKHRKNLENDVYNIVVGNSDGQKLRTKMDEAKNYGIDSTEYLLYQLARDVVDKPSKDGKYGTITTEELKDAFKLVGFSKKEKAYLWEAEGNSRRTNPYR